MENNDMARKIKELRKEQGLTLEQVASTVGVGKSTVRKWEIGMIANMRRDKIALLAKALNTSPAYLMGWENESVSTVFNRNGNNDRKHFNEQQNRLIKNIEDAKPSLSTVKKMLLLMQERRITAEELSESIGITPEEFKNKTEEESFTEKEYQKIGVSLGAVYYAGFILSDTGDKI